MRVLPASMPGIDVRAAKASLERILRTTPMEEVPERDRPRGSSSGYWWQSGITKRPDGCWRVSIGIREASRLEPPDGSSRCSAEWSFRSRGKPSQSPSPHSGRRRTSAHTVSTPRSPTRSTGSACPIRHWSTTKNGPGTASPWDAGVYQTTQPGAYFRMAELYEARGDRARAIDFYGRFTELWREADPQLQPRVAEAKRRIAELRKSIG